jgi:hypothetical protein
VGHLTDEIVGWYLVDGGFRDDYYVPAVWGDSGRLEPLAEGAESSDGLVLQNVEVRPTGKPRT